ncbi:dTMP kinase [Dehalogenimonas sp. 4OHTPN]|uniref:Thymidylate kinase n=1 Tax=Dehalogenimonas sp. 4OHTPN TaxID=3166643 RepID=A0AAU8G8Y9_9CHLR
MPLFITFEGGEGSGKSTQAGLLAKRLEAQGVSVLLTCEPGGTELGDRISNLLKWGDGISISPIAELMLFNASRAELVSRVIKPALDAGQVVVSDRFADSSLVYQGYGRGLPLASVRAASSIAAQGLIPDITFLLDVPTEHGFARKGSAKTDRIEQEHADFHRRVRDGYLAAARAEPDRWVIVNGTLPEATVTEHIWQAVQARLSQRTG